ncbi:hypothetical protein Q8F55_001742 [Vanrija albida]|uniref:CxC6 like cysteine cluster associated with KDZ domain-containing protein n=1 Tax=Vanrija albida TaxID=181172 RepID=A0ABR3Q7U2_9TREE
MPDTPPPTEHALRIDDDLYARYGPRKHLDPALAHLALHPHSAPRIPFLTPLIHLTGDKGAAVLDLLDRPDAGRFALSQLLVVGDTRDFVEDMLDSWPPFIYEGDISCDRCRSIDETNGDLCPCVHINLGAANKKYCIAAFKLSRYRCAAINKQCTYSLAQGEVVWRKMPLHARVLQEPASATALEHKVWWPGMRDGPVMIPPPSSMDNADERCRPAIWDAPVADAAPDTRPSKRARRRATAAANGPSAPVAETTSSAPDTTV